MFQKTVFSLRVQNIRDDKKLLHEIKLTSELKQM